MGSPDRNSSQRPPSTTSLVAGPYGPKNSLHSTTKPSYPPTDMSNGYEKPVFGSTTPLKSNLVSNISKPQQDSVGQLGHQGMSQPAPASESLSHPVDQSNGSYELGADSSRPHVSEIRARAAELMQPIRATAPPEQWRARLPTVDLTKEDDPTVISTPQNYPTFSRPQFNAINHGFNRSTIDLTRDGPARGPPVYPLPAGGVLHGTYYGGDFVDAAKTTESIKALLEGINDEPTPKVSKKKKKNKKPVENKVNDELTNMLGNAKLEDVETDKENRTLSHEQAVDAEDAASETDQEDEEEEEEEEDLSYVEGLKVRLLPHQIRGVAFLKSREEGKGRGGILADDMGLGKTVQSIAMVINHPNPRYPIGGAFSGLSPDSKKAALKIPEDIGRGTLVIAPLALIRQWEKEIDDKLESTHKLRVRVHHGPKRAKNAKDLRKYDVVITTYDIIRSEHGQSSFAEGGHTVGCFGIRWWRIICDEAHSIKNRLAKSSLAACALQARFRWCLTGTPIQNNLDELQSLIKFLRIPPYDDLLTWKDQITRPMQQNKGDIAIERLKVILGAIMLRRTKDVLKKDAEGKTGNQLKLPDRNMDKVTAPFNGKEKIFYTKLEERTEENLEKMMAGFGEFGGTLSGKNMTSALVLLLRLRQACNHPHLLAGKIHKDKDSGLGLATPRRSKAAAKPIDDVENDDDIANLMSGLSVDQQQCDVCLSPLTQTEKEAGVVRCGECDENIKGVKRAQGRSKKHREHRKSKKHYKGSRRARLAITSGDDEDGEPVKVKRRGRLAVLDSDDEDDAGSQAEHGTDTEGEDTFLSVDSQAEESSCEEDDSDSDYDEDPYSQLLESTKIARLLEILKKELKSKKKTIVFSQFTSMLDLIEPFLRRDGIAYARYDGSMKNDERERSLRRLRGDGEFAPRRGKSEEDRNWCGVLLCSLKCGALGLNLTCASRVVILEPFWNPFIEEQAIDRVHRIGQEDDVLVYKLTIEGSVEERILLLQEQKRELAKSVMGDGDLAGKAKATKLSMKDILYLFRRDAEGNAGTNSVLSTRTRILKERLPGRPANFDALSGGRYLTPQEEAEKEARRAREQASAYSRRW